MEVYLTPRMEDIIRDKVSCGLYESESDVVLEALRLLERRDRLNESQSDSIKGEIQKGIESGDGIPAEVLFSKLEAKYSEMAKEDD